MIVLFFIFLYVRFIRLSHMNQFAKKIRSNLTHRVMASIEEAAHDEPEKSEDAQQFQDKLEALVEKEESIGLEEALERLTLQDRKLKEQQAEIVRLEREIRRISRDAVPDIIYHEVRFFLTEYCGIYIAINFYFSRLSLFNAERNHYCERRWNWCVQN